MAVMQNTSFCISLKPGNKHSTGRWIGESDSPRAVAQHRNIRACGKGEEVVSL
jgi:hypothetical protein